MCLTIFQKGKKGVKTKKKHENFQLFILGKIGRENVFDNILEKKAFLDYKKQKVKTVKNLDFSKGVSPWFW